MKKDAENKQVLLIGSGHTASRLRRKLGSLCGQRLFVLDKRGPSAPRESCTGLDLVIAADFPLWLDVEKKLPYPTGKNTVILPLLNDPNKGEYLARLAGSQLLLPNVFLRHGGGESGAGLILFSRSQLDRLRGNYGFALTLLKEAGIACRFQ
ncbi:hypothetical protein [Angelakisella massiliensis]|uniref:hypothetical protein n=1 Tax=Angelakisella massiliensis TaxID=1871018 RepID=UPI0024B1B2B1|nr:hypothetical protein [Angelakisella massiliensis]